MVTSDASKTDLLIIGAGPAGLMAAAWASKYKIPARLIDDKPKRVQSGHADNLTCRSLEVLSSFGLANAILQDCQPDIQMRSWAPAPDGGIERIGTVNVQKPGISDFQQSATNQGLIEQQFENLLNQEGTVRIQRSVKTLQLRINKELALSDDLGAYPVEVDVQHGMHDKATGINAANGTHIEKETIRAKYVIGCDGAHSWTRRQVGLEMRGDSTNAVWGVMDIIPLTNFPDIRQTCVIDSKDHGAIHMVAREGKLVRLYILLAEADTTQNGRFDRSKISPRSLLETARKILSPYELDYKVCDWWSVYQVGQRIADDFAVYNRVFLAGDAIHTHSAKVGQGMNVSMGDTYNLTWKICSVLLGLASPSILSTYQSERRAVALALLDADRATTAYYQSKQKNLDLQTFRDEMYDFLSGVAVEYDDNIITSRSPQASPLDILVGRRFPFQSLTILNHASARPTRTDELFRSTGAWRIVLFAGAVQVPIHMSKIDRFTSEVPRILTHPAIETLTIVSCRRDDVALLSLPDILHPWDEKLGWDYEKVFADEEAFGAGGVYEKLRIDQGEGCVVVCRPDQVVGFLGGVDEGQRLREYFERFLM